MNVSLTFHGAAQTVTGSCYLIQTGGLKFLVDCGMYQGTKTLKELNYRPFPFEPREVDFVLLTHAHIDHSGLLPKLIKHGFAGPIYATPGTIDLLSCMLPDAGHIQEMEVSTLNRRNMRRGRGTVTPIYTVADAEHSLKLLRPVTYKSWISPSPNVRARYWNAGHLLGSASIEIEVEHSGGDCLKLLFSGDIGPDAELFHAAPEAPRKLDYVICESTYGGRLRPPVTAEARKEALLNAVRPTLANGGTVIIPAFAVERSQELLYDLLDLVERQSIPDVPIFLDSPLAARATEIFIAHAADFQNGHAFREALQSSKLRMTISAEESKGIERFQGAHIVVAASGMCEAGRIRHHLRNHLWRGNSTILLTGYQAQGTLGRILEDGAKAVRIQGEEIKVRSPIRKIDMYSGHADEAGLVKWLRARDDIRRAIFLTHGEPDALGALASRLKESPLRRMKLITPLLDDCFDLAHRAVRRIRSAERRLPAPQVVRLDWHNDLSNLWLDVSEAMDKAADDKARKVIIRRMRRSLQKPD